MRAKLWVLGWLAAALFMPRSLVADEVGTLPQLMEAMAAVAEMDATFTERKELTVLETPLESSGTLRYRAPDDMEKDVLYPEPMRYAISGDHIVIDQPGGEQKTFPLDQYPPLRVLIQSLRATLAGDEATLESLYRLSFSSAPGEWTLRLEPNDPDIAKRVVAIIISGGGTEIFRVETLEGGGDRSVMTVSPTVR